MRDVEALEAQDNRRNHPRFQGDNLGMNLRLVEKVEEMAREKGCTPAQLAIAWTLAQGEDVIPIPGTKRRTYLEENVGAIDVHLSADDLARLDRDVPRGAGAGTRYQASQMPSVNV